MNNTNSSNIKTVFIFIALIVITVIVIHYPSTSAFFCTDDFWHLEQAAYGPKFSELLKSFIPQGEVLQWARPLGRLYYFICYRLFGVNPWAFHLVSLSIHLVNAVLVFLIARKISRSDAIAFVSGLIFASHFALVNEVMWAAAIFDSVTGLCFFIAFLLYLYRDDTHPLSPYHICSLIAFIFAMRTKEMAITLPAVLLLYEITNFTFTKREIKKNLWQLVAILKKQGSYYVITLIYIILTFKGSTSLPAEGPYAFRFNMPTFLEGARFYLNSLLLKPSFFTNNIFYIVMVGSLIISFVLKDRHLIFGFFHTWISLLPVIFLAHHRDDMYLYIPIFGFSFFVANATNRIADLFCKLRTRHSIVIRITVVTFFLISYGYFNYPRLIFAQNWLRIEARIFERCINQLKSLHPMLPHGAHLYFIGVTPRFGEFPFLVKVSYDDPLLKTFFVNNKDFGQGFGDEKNNFYIFKYTKRKLMDITNFYKKGTPEPHNPLPYIELTQLFDKAEKKTHYPNHISLNPYCTVGSEQYSAILLGPRAKITFDLELPENPIFETAIAIPEGLWNPPADGVNFIVAINHGCSCGDEVIFKKYIDPMHNKSDRRWHDVEVDLSPFSYQKVQLILYSDSVGDDATAWTDWTAWGDPVIINKLMLGN